MKIKLCQIYLIIIFMNIGNFTFAVVNPSSTIKGFSPDKKEVQIDEFILNKNLNFKEKIILKVLNRKIRRQKNQKKYSKKISGIALAGFILGLAGLLIPGLGVLGLIFSLIALKRFNLEPDKKRGKKLAKIGVILSIIGIIITIYLLAIISAYLF